MAPPLSTPRAIGPTLDPRGSCLDGIDLLRGLAILFVLMNHVHMRLFLAEIPYTDGLPDQLVASLEWNGQSGVQIFFAVSGFLIVFFRLFRRTRCVSESGGSRGRNFDNSILAHHRDRRGPVETQPGELR